MDFAIETQGLVKQYHNKLALNQVSVHVEKGSIYGLIGKNGAGKTTLLKILGGYINATHGTASINGKDVRHIGADRKKVGALIEDAGFFYDTTGYQNMKMKCMFYGITDKNYINELLNLVGLSNVGKKKVKAYSLGMKQRLGIALALVNNPDILLLDEPINGLDPEGIVEVRETLLNISKRGVTIVISSHILSELSKIATHYGIISNGHLVREVRADVLESECKDKVSITVNDVETALNIHHDNGYPQAFFDEGKVAVPAAMEYSAAINRMLVSSGLDVSELNIHGIDLESYYLNLVSENRGAEV